MRPKSKTALQLGSTRAVYKRKRNNYSKTWIDFKRINDIALACLESLLLEWLPNGQKYGNEWIAINPTRSDKKLGSFKVNMRTGRWGDFSTNETGGDIISLRAYLSNSRQIEAAKYLSEKLGVQDD